MEKTFMEIWDTLTKIDVNPYIHKKKTENGKELSYLPWAIAWKLLIENYPNSTYKIHTYNDYPCIMNEYGGFVKTSVTVEGNTREMMLPIMNNNNKALKPEQYSYTTQNGTKTVQAVNSFDINKNMQRCLVKNLAMFGLGIGVFVGEDIPIDGDDVDEVIAEKAWEERRTEHIGGRGKNANIAWKDVDGGYLNWCIDREKNIYSDKHAEYAQKEIEWRTGNADYSEYIINQDGIEKMKEDLIVILDNITEKINSNTEYNKYLNQITEAKDVKKIKLIANRIKLVEHAFNKYLDKQINSDELSRIYLKAGISSEEELNKITKYLDNIRRESEQKLEL